MAIQDSLDLYAKFGVECLPLGVQSKRPYAENWVSRTFTPADFAEKANLGAKTGKVSNNLMDVDLDWAEAVRIAHYYLPPTQFIFGRATKPASHLWYRSKTKTVTTKFQVPGGGVVLELRGDAAQTMVPRLDGGTIHPSGEVLVFDACERIAEYDYQTLLKACGIAAAACVLLRNWVAGAKHDLAISVIGTLLRAEWPVEKIQNFLTPILAVGSDDAARQAILAEVPKLATRQAQGTGRVPGYARLKQVLGDVASTIADWLGITKLEEFVPSIISAEDLSKKPRTKLMWVVPDLIPEGVTILFGRPKSRKSFLALNVAVACASGGMALGFKQATKHDVLFIALEDSESRIQRRLDSILQGAPWPKRLSFSFEWQRGNTDALVEELTKNPKLKLIIIDTWTLFRRLNAQQFGKTAYEMDYAELQNLTKVCKNHHAAVLLVGHARKSVQGMDLGDLTEQINGSMGISGAVDSVLGLAWTRGEASAILHCTGKDIDEQQLAMEWDERLMCWKVVGDSELLAVSRERQEIRDLIAEHRSLDLRTLANFTGKRYHSVRKLCESMAQDGLLWKDVQGRNIVYRVMTNEDRPEDSP